ELARPAPGAVDDAGHRGGAPALRSDRRALRRPPRRGHAHHPRPRPPRRRRPPRLPPAPPSARDAPRRAGRGRGGEGTAGQGRGQGGGRERRQAEEEGEGRRRERLRAPFVASCFLRGDPRRRTRYDTEAGHALHSVRRTHAAGLRRLHPAGAAFCCSGSTGSGIGREVPVDRRRARERRARVSCDADGDLRVLRHRSQSQRDQQPEEYYGGLRGDETPSLGVCNVTIPPDHRVGEVERPFIASIPVVRRFSPSLEDPNKHVVIQGIAPLSRDGFLRQLRPRIAAARSREAFIFVHGFNTSFAKACRRTAQLANDLKAFEGIPLMYSWASVGSPSPRAYTADEGTIDWSVPHFEGFLGMVASETGATTVHLIAHSMGSRLLAATLQSLSKKAALPPQLGQLVCAAADMDAATFKSRYLPAFKSFPKRTTSYVSANDEALRLARQVALYARVGEAGRNILVTEGMDTIDVSPVDTTLLGHDYLATKAVFRDLFELLRHGT